MKTLIAFSVVAAAASAATAGSIGNAVSANGINNFLTESITVDIAYDGNAMTNGSWSGGDMFGITSRATVGSSGMPFAMGDDSAGSFPPDTQGIINAGDNGFFFGVVDTDNSNNPSLRGAAEWTFDITGNTSLSVDISAAAMGDFEISAAPGPDFNNFTWSIDGSAPAPLFTTSVDEAADQNYTMEGGAVVNLSDPMSMNGVLLNNNFQTINSLIAGSGATLTIAYDGGGNSGSEAFAFRDLNVNGVPTPGSIALVGLGGLAAARRRRA